VPPLRQAGLTVLTHVGVVLRGAIAGDGQSLISRSANNDSRSGSVLKRRDISAALIRRCEGMEVRSMVDRGNELTACEETDDSRKFASRVRAAAEQSGWKRPLAGERGEKVEK